MKQFYVPVLNRGNEILSTSPNIGLRLRSPNTQEEGSKREREREREREIRRREFNIATAFPGQISNISSDFLLCLLNLPVDLYVVSLLDTLLSL